MAGLDDYAQLMIELINRARADPEAEATRIGVPLESGLTSGAIDAIAKQPLAPSVSLTQAALGHSLWMLVTDTFSHTGVGGGDAGDRIDAAGYDWLAFGENLSMWGGSGPLGDLAEVIERQHKSLFFSPEHRRNMMKPIYEEIGVSQNTGKFEHYDVSMVTVNFGMRSGDARLTGVVYADHDRDRFYDPGEGDGGVKITAVGMAGVFETRTFSTGGYSLELAPGSYVVTYAKGDARTVRSVAIDGDNVKLDVIDLTVGVDLAAADTGLRDQASPRTIVPDADAMNVILGGEGDDALRGGGDRDWMEGGLGHDRFLGRDGDDIIFGGSGDDVIVTGRGDDYIDGGSGDDLIRALRGADVLIGGEGNDVILGGIGDGVIDGGPGDDRMRGGPGRDVFLFDIDRFGHDRILDFNPSSDTLDFRGSGLTAEDAWIRTIAEHIRIDFLVDDASIVLAHAASFGYLEEALVF